MRTIIAWIGKLGKYFCKVKFKNKMLMLMIAWITLSSLLPWLMCRIKICFDFIKFRFYWIVYNKVVFIWELIQVETWFYSQEKIPSGGRTMKFPSLNLPII